MIYSEIRSADLRFREGGIEDSGAVTANLALPHSHQALMTSQ